jgi:excisionase family DNA binding protein
MKPPRRPDTKTVEQVAAMFGRDARTIYRWRREGRIQGTRDGNYILFQDAEIERFNRDEFNGLSLQEQQDVAS